MLIEELSNDVKSQISVALRSSLGMNKDLGWDFNSHLLPSEIHWHDKILEIAWSPMVFDDQVDLVMVVIKDVTLLRKLQIEGNNKKLELEIIGQILVATPNKMKQFLDSAHHFLDPQVCKNADINELFRNMHTIKGNARSLQLSQIANMAHNIENTYDEVRKGIAVSSEKIQNDLSALRNIIAEYERLSLQLFGAQEIEVSNSLSSIIGDLMNSVTELANNLDKEVPKILVTQDANAKLNSKLVPIFRDSFMHLLRNSLDHGLEKREIRSKKGKDIQGTIKIEFINQSISIYDDGAGLNLEALRSKNPQKNLSDIQVAQTIFASGISTASQVSDISGRGVGMDAVKSFLEKSGCQIDIKFTNGREGDSFRNFMFVIIL